MKHLFLEGLGLGLFCGLIAVRDNLKFITLLYCILLGIGCFCGMIYSFKHIEALQIFGLVSFAIGVVIYGIMTYKSINCNSYECYAYGYSESVLVISLCIGIGLQLLKKFSDRPTRVSFFALVLIIFCTLQAITFFNIQGGVEDSSEQCIKYSSIVLGLFCIVTLWCVLKKSELLTFKFLSILILVAGIAFCGGFVGVLISLDFLNYNIPTILTIVSKGVIGLISSVLLSMDLFFFYFTLPTYRDSYINSSSTQMVRTVNTSQTAYQTPTERQVPYQTPSERQVANRASSERQVAYRASSERQVATYQSPNTQQERKESMDEDQVKIIFSAALIVKYGFEFAEDSNKANLLSKLNTKYYPTGYTALYDAVSCAILHLLRLKGFLLALDNKIERQFIHIVLTDGSDTSSKIKLDEAKILMHQIGTDLEDLCKTYFIGIELDNHATNALKALSLAGGKSTSFETISASNIESILDRIRVGIGITRQVGVLAIGDSALIASRSQLHVNLSYTNYLVLFTLDRSGSMAGSKWRSVINGVKKFLDSMQDRDMMGAVVFNESAEFITGYEVE